MQQVDLVMLCGALLLLALSVVSAFRPNLVWGNPQPLHLPPEEFVRLNRRRQIGTIVLFIAGAVLLILSVK